MEHRQAGERSVPDSQRVDSLPARCLSSVRGCPAHPTQLEGADGFNLWARGGGIAADQRNLPALQRRQGRDEVWKISNPLQLNELITFLCTLPPSVVLPTLWHAP
jgi:hypothetical protein